MGERLGVRIESNYIDIRMKPLDHLGQRARAAADVENSLAWPKRRLLEQRPVDRITAEQLHEGIVERQ
jgi:hypothetical protein